MRLGFIGLGKLGLPVAETMSEMHDVIGYDIDDVESQVIGLSPTLHGVVESSDMVFIAVPTPHGKGYDGSTPSSHLEPMDFGYDAVCSTLDQINATGMSIPVVLISTVLPGTVRRVLAPRLSSGRLIYNPYLIAMGTVADDFVNPEMLMIGNASGIDDADTTMLTSLYLGMVKGSPRVVSGTWEEMECTKIFYNTFISAKLGLVNMIQDVAQRIGHTNVDIVADALARSDKRIMGKAYMKPGMGDGGPCHPRDNIALRWLAKELDLGYDLFDAIMTAREVQAKNIAEELVRHGLPVFIWGESFKPGVSYTDGSYSRLVGHYCETLGKRPIYDGVSTNPAAYLLGHDVDYSTSLARIYKGSVVVDPWRRVGGLTGIEVISWGNTR